MITIAFQPDPIATVFGLPITNSFFTTIVVSVFLIVCSAFYALFHERRFFLFEALRVFLYDLLKLIDMVTQDRAFSKSVLPLVATFFIFIVSANLLALIPGFLGSLYVATPQGHVPLLRSPNSDLTTTVALSLFSVFFIQIFSIRALGLRGYMRRFFNIQSPLELFLGFFELLSEGVKVLSFSMRLFGNIFAGEILLLVIAFLVPYLIPIPFMILEIFVGIIQAFIFAMLTLTFIKTGMMRYIAAGDINNQNYKS